MGGVADTQDGSSFYQSAQAPVQMQQTGRRSNESAFSLLELGIRDQGDSKVTSIPRPLGLEVATSLGWLLV